MVVASPTAIRNDKIKGFCVPVIDLSCKKSYVSELIVKASEEFGFFKVINHGVSKDIIANMEREGNDFFGKSCLEKQKAGPPNPLGYGIKSIGLRGDMGEVEYLLLHSNPQSISQSSKSISKDPTKFSCAVNDYIQAVRRLACEILDLMADGLWVHDKSAFSNLIRGVECDSLIRLNHYPSCKDTMDWDKSAPSLHHQIQSSSSSSNNRIGFGEHTDPQILTILKSNDVGGLQVSLDNGVWVPIPDDPTSFCVNVGDILQALTNGRFVSARHRVLANSFKSRMSMVYFAAPPLHAWISPPPELITPQNPSLYRPFTWAEFKKVVYSLRLADDRLDYFLKCIGDDDIDNQVMGR